MATENEWSTGLGTTSMMWDMLSTILEESAEKLPVSLNEAIRALAEGKATVASRSSHETVPTQAGWYWVWQPKGVWPCDGVTCVVEVEIVRWPEGSELCAWVPHMDYSDPIDDEFWPDAKWLGPLDVPDLESTRG